MNRIESADTRTVRSFRFKNHILFRFLWQITQTRGVAREMSWPAARGLRRRVRVTFEIPEKATSPSSWRKRHVMFFHVFFMTNEKQTKWQTNQKQSLNLEQKNTFFSTYCCCFLFQSSQRPVRPFLWYRHLTNQNSQNLIGISSSMLGTGGGSTFFTSLASCALPMAWISLQPAALQLFSRAAALRVVGEIWMFIHFRTQESLK